MKKNYFDLTRKERKGYYKEFKKTPYGQEISIISKAISIVALVLGNIAVLALVIIVLFGEINAETEYTLFNIAFNGIAVYMLGLFLYLYNKSYLENNFAKWLKLEHKIEK
jgi:hypothetical protein